MTNRSEPHDLCQLLPAKAKALLLCLLLLSAGWSLASPPPKLWFQKQLQKDPAEQEAGVYRYQVGKGEYLYSILRGLGLEGRALPQAVQEIKRLNPNIQDLDRLQPGQEIALPGRLKPEEHQGSAPEANQDSNQLGQQIPTRSYQVKPGEHLAQILRQKLGLSEKLIFDEYLNLVLELNPDLENPDLLQAGDQLQLPQSVPRADAIGPGQDQPSLQDKDSLPTEKKAQAQPSSKRKTDKPAQRQLLLSLLKQLGFSFAPGQEMFLPLSDGGWLQLNLERSALARTPWGFQILFHPQGQSSLGQEPSLQGLDIRLCPVQDWSLSKVLTQLQETTERRLLIWNRDKGLILSREHRVLELEAETILVMQMPDKREYHLLQAGAGQLQGMPGLLLGYLQSQDIYFHFLDSDRENSFAPPAPPRTRDIYLPRLRELQPFAQQLSRPRRTGETRKEYLERLLLDQTSLQEKTIHLSWGGSAGARVSLALRLLQLETENESLLLLPPEQENPYLLALLRQAGYDCFVL